MIRGLELLARGRLDGKQFSAEVVDAVTSATLVRSIDGASNLQLSLIDRHMDLLISGAFDRKVDIKLGAQAMRMVGVQKTGRSLVITFEDLEIAELRGMSDPLHVKKGKLTRVDFAQMLVKERRDLGLGFVSPGRLASVAKISSQRPKSKATRTQRREPGLPLSAKFTIQGEKATPEQIGNIERVLDVCYARKVSRKLMLAATETIIVENWCLNRIRYINGKPQTDLDSVGMFQQRPSQGWTGLYNIEKATGEFLDKAIQRDRPTRTPGQLSQAVQGSAFPDRYDKRQAEATKIVDLYIGGNGVAYAQPALYGADITLDEWSRGSNGQREDSWSCLGRLAEEVRWRRFMVQGVVYFVPDAYLLSAKPVATIDEDSVGIDNIDFNIDIGKKIDTVTVSVRWDGWSAPPGSVVALRNLGPANGEWLVSEINQDLFKPTFQVTLVRPVSSLPEPRVTGTKSDKSTMGSALGQGMNFGVQTGMRERIVAVATKFLASASSYRYQQSRPMPSSIFSPAARNKLDCSSSSTLIYKEAGMPDPNGSNYNGSGDTGSLWRHGRKVSSLKPGDLVFYGWESGLQRPGHVVVYMGDGKVCTHGGSGAGHPSLADLHYRGDITGFRRYLDD